MVSENLAGGLVLVYLLPYCVVAGVLLLVGAALDWLPGVPSVLSQRYDRGLLAAISILAAPADAWPDDGRERHN